MRKSLVISLLLCTTGGLAYPAAAQDADAGMTGVSLEEIIVTAQKREESLQDTPISIAAFTAADIESKGIADITDLAQFASGLEVTPHPNSAATAQIFIRGVGLNEDQITQDGSVAVYLDGVYLGRSQGMANDVADIVRVEVLRGPQGTLYGRNATGGAVNFITAQPKLGDWHVRQQVSVGNYDLLRSKTAVNVPIGSTLAARLSYLYMKQNGFVENLGTNIARFGDKRRQAFRGDLLWEPSSAFRLRYAYDHSSLDDTPGFVARVPLYPDVAERPTQGSPFVADLNPNRVRADGHTLTGEWNAAPSLTIKSITAYRELDTFQNQSYHAGVLGPFPLFATASNINQKQFSQEVQLLGDALDDQLTYIIGGYYFSEQADSNRPNEVQTTDNRSIAFFGQTTWSPDALDRRLHLTAGVRWSKDMREASLIQGPQSASGDKDFSNVSPAFIIAYDLAEDVNVYAKVAWGYKTGGFNTRASSVQRFAEGFDQEKLVSYEAGLKSELLDRRLRLNLAGFVSKYDDIQVNIQSDPVDITVVDVLNAGKATIWGAELDVRMVPIEGLDVGLSYSYLHPRYDEIINAAGQDVSDNFRFVNSPAHSVSADATYTFPETPVGVLAANVSYTWRSKAFSSATIDRGKYIIGDYGLLNARLSLADIPGIEGASVALWGRNLTDKTYYVGHFNAGVPSAYFGSPRTYGVDLSFQF